MAGADWTVVGDPEQRYANLFAEQYSLVPPVPVQQALEEVADVEYVRLPGKGEAILLRKPHGRPRVIVSKRLVGNRNRFRFTLAHELGHLVLPWQVGSAFCHPEVTYVVGADFNTELEAQANRFASELLVPRPWLSNELGDDLDELAEQIIEIAEKAQVSPITASLALGPVYAVPAATCITDSSGKANYQVYSRSFRIPQGYQWWTHVDGPAGTRVTQSRFGPYTLHAIVCKPVPAKRMIAPSKHSSILLESILGVVPASSRQRTLYRINGIIGAANNYPEARDSEGTLLQILQQRFLGRSDLSAVVEHRLFGKFLRAKAHDIAQRHTASGPAKKRRSG